MFEKNAAVFSAGLPCSRMNISLHAQAEKRVIRTGRGIAIFDTSLIPDPY